MRYKVELDRQMASKENMKLQENLSRRQDAGTGLNFPSERSSVKVKSKSPSRQQVRVYEEQSEELRKCVYRTTTYMADTSVRGIAAANFYTVSNSTNKKYHCDSLRSSQPPSPRPTLTRKGELEKEYSIQASLDRETLRSDEDKSRRIRDFQNSRAHAKSVEAADKLRKQQEYAEQLNSQLEENREIKSDRNERQYEGDKSPSEDEVRREQRRQQVEYADQLKRQMEEKQVRRGYYFTHITAATTTF